MSVAPTGPAIWRAERLKMILWIILAKEPACRYGVLPDASTGHPEYSGWYFSHKAVTYLTLTDRRERHGVQGGGACPAGARRMRGRTFCRPGTEFYGLYELRGTELSRC